MNFTRRDAIALTAVDTLAATRTLGAVTEAPEPRFGMNLYLFTDAVTPDFYPLLRDLRALGYAGVEIPITRGHGERFGELRRLLDDEGLACTTLTSLKPESNPVSPDPRTRGRALDDLKWAIDTGPLGSQTLSGPLYAASNSFTGAGPTGDELAWSADVLRQACEHAEPVGARLCLEFLNRFEGYLVNTVSETMALIGRVGAGNIGIAYDTHHAHIEESGASAAITAAGARLHHTHISESHRGTLGMGQVDWSSTFRSLKTSGYSGWLMVEAFASDVQPLARSAHVWRNTFQSKAQVARDGISFLRKKWTAT